MCRFDTLERKREGERGREGKEERRGERERGREGEKGREVIDTLSCVVFLLTSDIQ